MPAKKMKILVTAGNTREMIDPVRYVSNVSTGVMGYEIAKAARREGHEVVLISGPAELPAPAGVKRIDIVSSRDLEKAMEKYFPWCEALFMTSAVCDFRPAVFSRHKIKRQGKLSLKLEATPDILRRFSAEKGRRKVIGFCLETEALIANAERKLTKKKLDFIVANFLGKKQTPFGAHPTSVSVLSPQGLVFSLRQVSKARVAKTLMQKLL